MSSVFHAIQNNSKLYSMLSGSYNINPSQLFRYEDIITTYQNTKKIDLSHFSDFVDVERKLNESKINLESIESSYFHLVDMFSFLKPFYENRKNAQLVTSSWLNFSEIFIKYNIINKKDEFNVFFNVELPDSTFSAANHYCNSNNIKLNWLASHSMPINIDNTMSSMNDINGIYDKYQQNWIDIKKNNMNGDFTDINNILIIQKRVLSQYTLGVDLYISNIGVNNLTDFSNLEVIYSNIYFGHILNGLLILKRGGNMCIKQFTFFKPLTLSILLLLSNLFKTIEFVTTSSINCITSEIYLVCKGFFGLSEILKTKLIDLFKIYSEIKDTSIMSLIPFYNINTFNINTLNDFKTLSKSIFEDIYSNINKNISIILENIDYQNLEYSINKLKENLLPLRIELEDNYIFMTNIKKLEQKYMILTKKNIVNIDNSFSQHIIQMGLLYKSPINYREILIVDESKYSCLRPDHMESVKLFYEKNIPLDKDKQFNIIDGTANVGVDSMFLTTLYNSPNVSIISIEINKDTYYFLEKNVMNISKIVTSKQPFTGKIIAKNMDIVKYISELSSTEDISILYLDPPWGGHQYIDNPAIELSLGKMSFSELVALAIYKKIKNIVCKVPKTIQSPKFIDDVYQHLLKKEDIQKLEPAPSQFSLYTANKFDISIQGVVSYSIIYFKNNY